MAILKPLQAQPGGGMMPLPIRPTAKPTQIGSDPAMAMSSPAMPKPMQPIRTATSPGTMAASQSLSRPMSDLRAEANGGSLPPPTRGFNDPVQNRLGTMSFSNLQPRRGGAGTPPPAGPGAGTAGTEQSYAGMTPYFEAQVGGAPRRISGRRGARPGARYTSGPMKGKTADQAMLKSRENYARLSPEQKAQYEAKARMEDISSPVPGIARPTLPPPGPVQPQRTSIDGAELAPIRPGIVPNITPSGMNSPMVPKRKPSPSYLGGSAKYDDSMDY